MSRFDALFQLLEEVRRRSDDDAWVKKVFSYHFPTTTVHTSLNFALTGPSNNAAVMSLLGIHTTPGYEPIGSFVALVATQNGGTFLDIGANLGYFSLLTACNTDRPFTVHAFEPLPSNFRFLVENIRINRKISVIHPYPVGLGEKDGTLEISKYGTGASFVRGWDSGQAEKAGLETAQVKRLDSLFTPNSFQHPVTLKIDVEGFEASVVRGAEGVIRSQHTACILLECGHSLHPQGFNPHALETIRLLETWGYECYGIKSTVESFEDPQEEALIPFALFNPDDIQKWASAWVCLRQGHPLKEMIVASIELYPIFHWTYRRTTAELASLAQGKDS